MGDDGTARGGWERDHHHHHRHRRGEEARGTGGNTCASKLQGEGEATCAGVPDRMRCGKSSRVWCGWDCNSVTGSDIYILDLLFRFFFFAGAEKVEYGCAKSPSLLR
jgi:hypothetical protein